MNDIEILKEYLQYKLDSGFHKLFYNDLDWEIKTIDCINAINALQQENQQLKDELEWYKQQCDDLEMQIGCQE